MRKPENSDSFLLFSTNTSGSANETETLNQWRSTFLLRVTGYILLILALLDIAALMIPFKLFEPVWEFETIGKLVSRAPVPLIALALIFYGGMYHRQAWEKLSLRPVAILGIIFGLVLIVLTPVSIMSGIRVGHLDRKAYATRQAQQEQTFSAYEERFKTTPAQDLSTLARSFNLKVSSTQQVEGEALRTDILGQLNNLKAEALKQARASHQDKRQSTIKNMFKWALGAFLSGFCLIYLGQGALKLFQLAPK